MTKTCPDCKAEVLSTSQPNRMGTTAEPDAWEWRACIGGKWGAWLYLDQPVDYFKGRNAFNLDNGTYELRPLYAALAAMPAVGGERKRIAKTIYDVEPHHESGEYVDGFQVSPGGNLSWEQAKARSEDLALAYYRDKAYERLHSLCGTRNDAPNWTDIACILRERDELYERLRASPPEQPAAAQPQYLIPGCLRAGECHDKCLSRVCKHANKVIVKRVCVEDRKAGVIYQEGQS